MTATLESDSSCAVISATPEVWLVLQPQPRRRQVDEPAVCGHVLQERRVESGAAPGSVRSSASWRRSGRPVLKPWTYSSGVSRPSGSKNTCAAARAEVRV